jgi:hypothetical protein
LVVSNQRFSGVAHRALGLLEADLAAGSHMQVIAWTVGAVVIGFLLYPLLQKAREYEWCRFVGPSPHQYKVALRGGIPQSPSLTSFAAVYGTVLEHEVDGLHSDNEGPVNDHAISGLQSDAEEGHDAGAVNGVAEPMV